MAESELQRETVSFHVTWTADESAVLSVLPAVEERLAPFDPRPHWAKLFTTAPAAVHAQYERLSDFASRIREYDPTGKFSKDLTDRYLG